MPYQQSCKIIPSNAQYIFNTVSILKVSWEFVQVYFFHLAIFIFHNNQFVLFQAKYFKHYYLMWFQKDPLIFLLATRSCLEYQNWGWCQSLEIHHVGEKFRIQQMFQVRENMISLRKWSDDTAHLRSCAPEREHYPSPILCDTMGVGKGEGGRGDLPLWILKIIAKKVVFLVSIRKNNFHHSWYPVGIHLEKSTSAGVLKRLVLWSPWRDWP